MKHVPKILVIGAGRFGARHLAVLRRLEKEKLVSIAGVVVKTTVRAQELIAEGFAATTRFTEKDLRCVDAVAVLTPGRTHYAIVKKCLTYTHVFVEKPLAETSAHARELARLARKHKKALMVGHIYRFHPVVEKLKHLLAGQKPGNIIVRGRMVSPLDTWKGEKPAFEKLHFFDIVDYLWPSAPTAIWSRQLTDSLVVTDIRYAHGLEASFRLGWEGTGKERLFEVNAGGKTYSCDLPKGTISISAATGPLHTVRCEEGYEPLESEWRKFLNVLARKGKNFPDGEVGARVVEVAERCTNFAIGPGVRPRVAIMGAGIFGLTAALHLAPSCDVTVYERDRDIMSGASWKNQHRHHVGYHYPRSPETIAEIKRAAGDFERFYGHTILRDFPSYYAVATSGSHLSAEQFVDVCDRLGLPYTEEYPDPQLLDPHSVSISLKTPEAVTDYEALKAWLMKKIAATPSLRLNLKHDVTGARIAPTGKKILNIKTPRGKKSESFDYVINATYSNYNQLCSWMGFARRNLELRFKEIIIVKLPVVKPAAVTIVDGPFATLVPIGKSGLYTFGDVPLSIRAVGDGANGEKVFARLKRTTKTRWLEMRERCRQWFPILDKAEYIDSMFVILPVEKSAASTDARPTELTEHGFGCFSILSGKIITSVVTAQELVRKIS